MELINGGTIAQKILDELKTQIRNLVSQPVLCDILVGTDPVALSYVNIKKLKAEQIGIKFELLQLPAQSTTNEVCSRITALQTNSSLKGLIVQLPLPEHIDRTAVLDAIDPKVDVDCLGKINSQFFYSGQGKIIPPTAAAIMEILGTLPVDLRKARILVIGQGDLVGRPVSFLLKRAGYDLSTADESTGNLKDLTRAADVIISATGKPKLLTADLVKPGVVLIDCGTAESAGSIVGDVDESAWARASFVSPVPGGVGPMTVAMLLKNVIQVSSEIKSNT